MVVNIQAERAPARFERAAATSPRRARHYDSFVVRVWKEEGADTMLRVELQHVQADLSMEAVQVPLEWIVPEMLNCLGIDPNATRESDNVR